MRLLFLLDNRTKSYVMPYLAFIYVYDILSYVICRNSSLCVLEMDIHKLSLYHIIVRVANCSSERPKNGRKEEHLIFEIY